MIRHTMRHRRNGVWDGVLCGGIACAALFVAGCSGVDPAQQAIENARAKMAKISVAGASVFPRSEVRTQVYRGVLEELKKVGETAEAGQQTAAQSLAARAHAGLGEVAALQAAEAESGFANDVGVARAVLDEWVGQNSVADAAAAFDPSKDLADKDSQIAARTQEATASQAQRDKLQSQVAALESQAKAAQSEAKTLRDADSATRAAFGSMTQTARAAALEAAATQRRQADQYEKTASTILADVDRLRPQVDEQQAQTTRLQKQIELLGQAKAGILKHQEETKAQAAAARAEAVEAGKRLDSLLAALTAKRQSVAEPTQAALKSYTAAVGAAKKAKLGAAREGQASMAAAAGSFEQSRADILAARSRGVLGYARLMGDAALAKPALPNAAQYTEQAQALTTEAENAAKEAVEAFKSARALFKSVSGGSAEAQAHLKAIDAALGRIAPEAAEPVKAPEGQPGSEPAPDASPAPTPPAAAPAANPAAEPVPAEPKTPPEPAPKG